MDADRIKNKNPGFRELDIARHSQFVTTQESINEKACYVPSLHINERQIRVNF